jgi:hypothetical protein
VAEIRPLAISAWTNHTDVAPGNTLDMYVTDGGRSFGPLPIDFSGLSSADRGPEAAAATSTREFCSITKPPDLSPSVPGTEDPGCRQSIHRPEVFDPAWRPHSPNSAFDERTGSDICWRAHRRRVPTRTPGRRRRRQVFDLRGGVLV